MKESNKEDFAKLDMLGQSNVYLTLSEPVEIIGMYGLRKRAKEIRIQVDCAEELCKLLRNSCRL
jgi:hypothetical protein